MDGIVLGLTAAILHVFMSFEKRFFPRFFVQASLFVGSVPAPRRLTLPVIPLLN
jgi:hypothetical protein